MKAQNCITFGRRALLSAALISIGLGGLISSADARKAPGQDGKAYRMVGELSEEDVLALWPPARRQTSTTANRGSNTRFYYRAYRGVFTPLGDWAGEQSPTRTELRMRQLEQKLHVTPGAGDRDFDGVPDNQDTFPWDRNRW